MANSLRIVTHTGFHVDEIFAVILLRMFGKEMFPGVETAPIFFVSAGIPLPDRYKTEGNILVGIGGGIFDEHPGQDVRKARSASRLVVEKLGIDLRKNRGVKYILEYVDRVDSTPTGQPFELPSLLKSYHFQNPGNDKKLWKVAELLLQQKLQEQNLCQTFPAEHHARKTVEGSKLFYRICTESAFVRDKRDPAVQYLSKEAERIRCDGQLQPFHLAAILDCAFMTEPTKAPEFERAARLLLEAKWWEQHNFHLCASEWPNAEQARLNLRGQSVLIAGIKSDNAQMAKWARANENCGVLVRMDSQGHVQIMANGKLGLNMDAVAAELRKEEQQLNGGTVETDPKTLSAEGRIAGAECWWYHKDAGNIYNGSTQSAADTPPTKIPWETILDIVYNNVM